MTERKKIVITNLDYGQNYTILSKKLADEGYELTWAIPGNYSPAETVRAVKGYDAVIAGGEKYDRWALDQLKDNLRAIFRHGTGTDNIDISAAAEMGIAVTNAPGRNARAVAEHALGMMLGLSRNICVQDRRVRSGSWAPGVSHELYGKTVGIIGFGDIGKWLARLLGGFNCRILVSDKFLTSEQVEAHGAELVDRDRMLEVSDFISLHLPLTAETENSVDINFFRSMKDTSIFINSSRGKIVVEDDLLFALKSGVIAGAGLDVFANGPLDSAHELCSLENVILSPHTSACTTESMQEMMDCSVKDMTDFFSGRTPSNLLNPAYKKSLTITGE